MIKLPAALALAALTLVAEAPAALPSPRIGVYYFPGWNGPDSGWKAIAPYPERKPALGWYRDGDPATMAKQLGWMKRYGIDYVAFDWYWENDAVHADQAINAYLATPRQGVQFALLFANDKPTLDAGEWRRIVGFWIDHYLKSPRYLTVAGKPVVFILSYQGLETTSKAAGSSVNEYVAAAQHLARAAGLPGLYLVGNTDDLSTAYATEVALKDGMSAISAYNMHRRPWAPQKPGWERLTRGYPALDAAYRENWAEARRATVPVVVPMTAGWDRRPWGGSSDPLHDRSVATPEQFHAHLAAARRIMALPGRQRSGLGIICCWNEFGEGSFIEPTERHGTAVIEQVGRVFGR